VILDYRKDARVICSVTYIISESFHATKYFKQNHVGNIGKALLFCTQHVVFLMLVNAHIKRTAIRTFIMHTVNVIVQKLTALRFRLISIVA